VRPKKLTGSQIKIAKELNELLVGFRARDDQRESAVGGSGALTVAWPVPSTRSGNQTRSWGILDIFTSDPGKTGHPPFGPPEVLTRDSFSWAAQADHLGPAYGQ
jgi:hypothetical protein